MLSTRCQATSGLSQDVKRQVAKLLRSSAFAVGCVKRPVPGALSLFDHGSQFILPAALQHGPYRRSIFYNSCLDLESRSACNAYNVLNLHALLNPHERDSCLTFDASSHTYAWNGRCTLGLVTGLIKLVSQPFDPDAVIAAMRAGANWPKAGYVIPYASLDLLAQLANMPGSKELRDALLGLPHSEVAVIQVMLRT